MSRDAQHEFNAEIGLLSDHRYFQRGNEVAEYINDNDYNDAKNKMDEIIKDNVTHYIDDTFKLLMLNNLTNTTNYLYGSMSHEQKQLHKAYTHMKNNIHKLRLTVMDKQFTANHRFYQFRMILITNILCIIVLGLFALNLQERIPMQTAIILSAIVAVFYIIYILVMITSHNSRRRDDWNKFNFNSPKM